MGVLSTMSGPVRTHRVHALCKISAEVATGALGFHVDMATGPEVCGSSWLGFWCA